MKSLQRTICSPRFTKDASPAAYFVAAAAGESWRDACRGPVSVLANVTCNLQRQTGDFNRKASLFTPRLESEFGMKQLGSSGTFADAQRQEQDRNGDREAKRDDSEL